MNKTAIEAPLNQEFNLEEELEKVLNQESNLQEELDKADAVQNNAPDDDEVAYLEHEKSLNEKGHLDSEDENFSSDAQSGSGSSSEDEKSFKRLFRVKL